MQGKKYKILGVLEKAREMEWIGFANFLANSREQLSLRNVLSAMHGKFIQWEEAVSCE